MREMILPRNYSVRRQESRATVELHEIVLGRRSGVRYRLLHTRTSAVRTEQPVPACPEDEGVCAVQEEFHQRARKVKLAMKILSRKPAIPPSCTARQNGLVLENGRR